MNPIELLKTIYLGDRAIEKIIIDGYNQKIAIQCDCISSLPHGQSTWDFYDKEDIEHGFLVFSCARTIKISPIGAIANDYISSVNIAPSNNEQLFTALISVGGYDPQANRCEVIIEIEFTKLSLEKTYDLSK
jgi:hypothetical protein